jgi:MYND finger
MSVRSLAINRPCAIVGAVRRRQQFNSTSIGGSGGLEQSASVVDLLCQTTETLLLAMCATALVGMIRPREASGAVAAVGKAPASGDVGEYCLTRETHLIRKDISLTYACVYHILSGASVFSSSTHAAAKMKVCSVCGAAFHCNADHLRAYWNLSHKRACKCRLPSSLSHAGAAFPGRHIPRISSTTTAHLRTHDLDHPPVPRTRSTYLRRGGSLTGRRASRRHDVGHS